MEENNPINSLGISLNDYSLMESDNVLGKLTTSLEGLEDKEAQKRLKSIGHNEVAKKKKKAIFIQILSKFLITAKNSAWSERPAVELAQKNR